MSTKMSTATETLHGEPVHWTETKMFFCGGGTGGHIYPSVALAQAFEERHVGGRVIFLGTRRGLEADILKALGKPFLSVAARPLPARLFSIQTPIAFLTFLRGTLQATRLLKRERPVAVIGTGGYASACTITAASRLKIPSILFEANTVPGRTNLGLARKASLIAVGFAEAVRYFPTNKNKVVFTGTPVRREFLRADRAEARRRLGLDDGQFMLLVFGGSQGAKRINEALFEAVLPLVSAEERLVIFHLYGKTGHESAMRLRSRLNANQCNRYRPYQYVHDIYDLVTGADLSLCRAGSSSIAELLVAGVPAILVPYPYAAGDHQRYNALSVVQANAATIIEDAKLNGEAVVEMVLSILRQPDRLEQMRTAARRAAKPDAADKLIALACQLTSCPCHREVVKS